MGVNVTGSHVADFYPNEVSGSMQLAPFVPWIERTAGVKALEFERQGKRLPQTSAGAGKGALNFLEI